MFTATVGVGLILTFFLLIVLSTKLGRISSAGRSR